MPDAPDHIQETFDRRTDLHANKLRAVLAVMNQRFRTNFALGIHDHDNGKLKVEDLKSGPIIWVGRRNIRHADGPQTQVSLLAVFDYDSSYFPLRIK